MTEVPVRTQRVHDSVSGGTQKDLEMSGKRVIDHLFQDHNLFENRVPVEPPIVKGKIPEPSRGVSSRGLPDSSARVLRTETGRVRGTGDRVKRVGVTGTRRPLPPMTIFSENPERNRTRISL